MEPLLIFPDPAPPALAQALDLAGYPWKAAGSPDAAERLEPEDGWAGAIVCADDDPEGAFALCRALRKRDLPFEPLLLLVVAATQLAELELREDLFDDFCLTPVAAPGAARPASPTCSGGPGGAPGPSWSSTGRWCSTWRPTRPRSAGRPLDLTYMEYELLKFLATHPGKVFTRETLLSRVWGYEYYGGARTVDVHIRRLRAKLGEEHANLISTVRSVGYRFGQSRLGDLTRSVVGLDAARCPRG